MTPIVRYPVRDWSAELDEHEDSFVRLDDHLTDEETRERWARLDAIAIMGHWSTDTAVIADDPVRHGYGRSFLGLLGLIVAVCGVGAVVFGLTN